MKNNLSYLTIFLILVVFNIILIGQVFFNNDSVEANKLTIPNNSLPDSALNKIKDISLKSNEIEIDSTLILITSIGDKVHLYDAIDKLPTIVLNYQYYSCKVCIDDELFKLSQIADKIGAGNVIAIGSFTTQREQLVTEKNFGIRLFSFYSKNFNLPVDTLNQAYFFVIDSNWRTMAVYVPLSDLTSMKDIYYSIVLNKYFVK